MPIRNGLLGVLGAAAMLGLAGCAQPAQQAAAPAAPVAATPPPPAAPQFADLKGARASSGEGEMERRGFTVARQRGLTAFWLNAPSGTCVRTVTANGRYQTVEQVDKANCGA
jgi:hypothetical protein